MLLTEVDLPPTDRGAAAWKFVLGAWWVEAMLWGFPLSFGIFQAHYAQHELFTDSKNIAIIGALATGISNLGLPFVSPVALRFPQYQRHMVCFGWCLCCVSLVGASFATQVWHLILSQGVLYGSGWVICYTPFLIMLNEWFVKKRGLVYGILFGASGVSGLILPFILEASLSRFGFRVTLRAFAIAVVVVSGPALVLLKPRVVRKNAVRAGHGTLQFVTDKTFWLFAIAVFLQGIGFYLPAIFLPSFAHALSLSHAQGALLLALCSLAQVTGQMALGQLSDKVDMHILTSLSAGVPATAAFLLWGPAKSFAPLAVFALLYSGFGGGYSVLWSRVTTYMSDDPGTAMVIFGIFSFERGFGNMLAGPISTWLLADTTNISDYGLARYSAVIQFVGVTMALSSLSGIGYFWSRPAKRKNLTDKFEDYSGEMNLPIGYGRTRAEGTSEPYELERLASSTDSETEASSLDGVERP